METITSLMWFTPLQVAFDLKIRLFTAKATNKGVKSKEIGGTI